MREPNVVDRFIRYNPELKALEPVWWRRDVLPFWLYPDEQWISGAFTINASPTATPPIVYKLPHASLDFDQGLGNPLRITQIVFEDSTDTTTAADWTVLLEDMGDKLKYMNAEIHVRTFAGGVRPNASGVDEMLPAMLFEPLFLPSRHNLMLTPDKRSGSAVSARLFFVGELFCTWSTKLRQHALDYQIMTQLVSKYLERRKYVTPFWLTPEVDGVGGVLIGANQTVTADALIGDDAHFEGATIMKVSTGDFQVEILNPLTRQGLMNGTLHSDMIGDAFTPQPLPARFLVPTGQMVRFKITDLSGDTNKVWLTIHGRKIRAPFRDIKTVLQDTEVKEPAGGQK